MSWQLGCSRTRTTKFRCALDLSCSLRNRHLSSLVLVVIWILRIESGRERTGSSPNTNFKSVALFIREQTICPVIIVRNALTFLERSYMFAIHAPSGVALGIMFLQLMDAHE